MPRDVPPGAALLLRGTGATDRGRRRKHNEDVVLVREDLQLFIVADGAGGHKAGDVAARLAAWSIANYIEATESEDRERPEFDRFGLPTAARRLSSAVHKANSDVHEIASSCSRTKGMGTTVVAVLFSPRSGLLHLSHVGDSRCYRLRGGHLELMTQDHSLLTDVLEEHPDLEDAVLETLPKHAVTRALGMKATARVSLRSHEALPGDRYLLCSDGLSSYVPARVIARILGEPRPPDAVVQLLLNAANDAGGRDNVAVVVADCVAVEPVREPELWRPPLAEPEILPERAGEPELLLLSIEELELERDPHTLPGMPPAHSGAAAPLRPPGPDRPAEGDWPGRPPAPPRRRTRS